MGSSGVSSRRAALALVALFSAGALAAAEEDLQALDAQPGAVKGTVNKEAVGEEAQTALWKNPTSCYLGTTSCANAIDGNSGTYFRVPGSSGRLVMDLGTSQVISAVQVYKHPQAGSNGMKNFGDFPPPPRSCS
jgi:hypothetical protein